MKGSHYDGGQKCKFNMECDPRRSDTFAEGQAWACNGACAAV